MTWRCAIAVDVGGTFTDLVFARSDGQRQVAKVPSVPTDPSRGVFDALESACAEVGLATTDVLARCDRFVHGSTIATNALLTGNLARVALISTAGFRDSLEIRRGIRENQWDHRAPWPPVLVPRHLRCGVRGRMSPDGGELEVLNEADVRAAVAHFTDEGVAAVAVCLLHSYANPVHEQQVASILRQAWPGALTTLSSDLVPLLGEYERTSTAVVNAGLVPSVGGYLATLASGLEQLGLRAPLLMLQSNGGTVPVDAVQARPVDLVLSGPAAVGGATRRLGVRDQALVSLEIGGTSCDVAVSVNGLVPVTDGLVVAGYHLNVAAVDVHSVGAGGGTLASVDAAGMLCVGPEGAGADPGPACYGRGGTRPTATDMHLILGRLKPGAYAGGAVELDHERAVEAVRTHLAEPLGIEVEEAAIGALAVLEQQVRHAVETITIERGRDPRQMTLVAAGGAGGLHASSVARALGCGALVIPAEAGVFCAVGMLHSNLRRDVARSVVVPLDGDGVARALELLGQEQDHVDALTAREWPVGTERETAWHVDLRYPGQLWSVRVAVDVDDTTASIRARFEAEYQRLYGHIQPGGKLEITAVGVAQTGLLVDVAHPAPDRNAASPPVGHRRCWVDSDFGWGDVAVYQAEDLGVGSTVHGPYVVEARTTTVLGRHGDRLTVNSAGDFEVDLT